MSWSQTVSCETVYIEIELIYTKSLTVTFDKGRFSKTLVLIVDVFTETRTWS